MITDSALDGMVYRTQTYAWQICITGLGRQKQDKLLAGGKKNVAGNRQEEQKKVVSR